LIRLAELEGAIRLRAAAGGSSIVRQGRVCYPFELKSAASLLVESAPNVPFCIKGVVPIFLLLVCRWQSSWPE